MEDYMATKTAFITGASRGIGRACAIALAQAGNRVALAARDLAKLGEVADEVRALGAEAHVVAIDMASFDSIKDAIASTSKDFGRIAAQNLLGTDLPIGRMRGHLHHYGPRSIPVVVTYHPAYLLRSPGEKRKSWEDLRLALKTYRTTAAGS
mgnify:CR=1 FL=1